MFLKFPPRPLQTLLSVFNIFITFTTTCSREPSTGLFRQAPSPSVPLVTLSDFAPPPHLPSVRSAQCLKSRRSPPRWQLSVSLSKSPTSRALIEANDTTAVAPYVRIPASFPTCSVSRNDQHFLHLSWTLTAGARRPFHYCNPASFKLWGRFQTGSRSGSGHNDGSLTLDRNLVSSRSSWLAHLRIGTDPCRCSWQPRGGHYCREDDCLLRGHEEHPRGRWKLYQQSRQGT